VTGCKPLPCDPVKLEKAWLGLADPGDAEAALGVIEGACEPTFTAAARRWMERGIAPDTTTDLGVAVHDAWADLCPGGPDLAAATGAPLLDARRRTVEACGVEALGVGSEGEYIHATGSPALASLVARWLVGQRRDPATIEALAGAVRGAPRLVLPPDVELVRWSEGAHEAPARVELVLTPTGLYRGGQVLMLLDRGQVPPGFRSAGKGRLRGPFAPEEDPLADWALAELRALDDLPEPLAIAVDGRVPVATLRRVAASLVAPGGEVQLVGMGTLGGLDDRLTARSIRLPFAVVAAVGPPADLGSLAEEKPIAELAARLDASGTDVRLALPYPPGLPCMDPPVGMVCVPGAPTLAQTLPTGAFVHQETFYLDRDPLPPLDEDPCPADYCAPGGDELAQRCAWRGKRAAGAGDLTRARTVLGDGLPDPDGPRCVSRLPELNTHPAPALTEIRLPRAPLDGPAVHDVDRFHRTPDEPLSGLPICTLDDRGVRPTWNCRAASAYAPPSATGSARYLPYLAELGGGYVGFGGAEDLTLAAHARAEWLWLVTDDPARATLLRVLGGLIGASATADELMERLSDEALPASRTLLGSLPADAEGVHVPADVFAAVRRELATAWGAARAAAAAGETPDLGVAWVADPEDYDHLHRMWRTGRARVLLADPTGDGWLDVGNAAHDLGTPVRAVHLAALPYAWGGALPGGFRDGIAALPLDSRAVVLQRLADRPVPAGGAGAWQFHVHGGRDYQARVADSDPLTAADVAALSAPTDDPRLFIAGVPGR